MGVEIQFIILLFSIGSLIFSIYNGIQTNKNYKDVLENKAESERLYKEIVERNQK